MTMRQWITAVKLMESDIHVLNHNGPSDLPNNKPTAHANYFGLDDFSDVEGYQFGDTRYVYQVPPYVRQSIVNIRSREATALRRDAAKLAGWDDDDLDAIDRGELIEDFYEVFCDKESGVTVAMEKHGVLGARYGSEVLLLAHAIVFLQLIDKRQDTR